MADANQRNDDEAQGSTDAVSVLYVLCGIPAMIVFFLGLFALVGACDLANIQIPA